MAFSKSAVSLEPPYFGGAAVSKQVRRLLHPAKNAGFATQHLRFWAGVTQHDGCGLSSILEKTIHT
jgi:hypothetical protein